MTKEVIKKQERLYELECNCTTDRPITEEEQMQRIREVASGEFRIRMREKVKARIRELPPRNC